MLLQLASVALGGAIGAMMRFSLTLIFPFVPGQMPIASLVANVAGCLIMGSVYFWLEHGTLNSAFKPLIVAGFLGALTTFSTFALEAWLLLQHNAHLVAIVHVLVNVVACIAAVAIGYMLAGMLGRIA